MSKFFAMKVDDTSGITIPYRTIANYYEGYDKGFLKEKVFSIRGGFYVTINPDKYMDEKTFIYNQEDETLEYYMGEHGSLCLELEDGEFVGDGDELYAKTNYGWAERDLINIVKEFKGNVIIHDRGDEEYGFVDEFNCTRDVEPPQKYINGKLVK